MILGRKIKLICTAGQIRFGLISVLLVILPITLGSETYKSTTYYPAPFASYHKSRALIQVNAGDNSIVQLKEMAIGGQNKIPMITPQIWSRQSGGGGGSIMLAPSGEKVNIETRIRDFCKWVQYGVLEHSSLVGMDTPNAFCPTTHPFATAISNTPNASGMGYTANVTNETGWMLCCRFTAVN